MIYLRSHLQYVISTSLVILYVHILLQDEQYRQDEQDGQVGQDGQDGQDVQDGQTIKT